MLRLYHHPLHRASTRSSRRSSPTCSTRSLQQGGAVPRPRLRRSAARCCMQALAFDNPDRVLWEAAAAVPFTAFCAAGDPARPAPSQERLRLPRDGLPGRGAATATSGFSYRRKLARELHEEGLPPVAMAERVDVCIVGSGFGGSIAAWRLAELYRAAGVDPKNILVLERGRRFKHTDFRQSMDIDHLSDVYSLIQSTRAPARRSWSPTASAAARTSTSPHRSARRARPSSAATTIPTTAPSAACGRSEISRRALDPYYRRAERALRVRAALVEPGVEVRRALGGDARRRRPHLRPRPAARSTSSAASTPSGATPAASSARRTR